MNKLSKEKRDHLILVAMGTLILVVGLWYGVIANQQKTITGIAAKSQALKDKQSRANLLLRQGPEVEEKLAGRAKELAERECVMAPDRDTYSWMLNTLNPFLIPRRGLSIPTISQPEFAETVLIPKFPYKSAVFHLRGVGYYSELGSFIAEFENHFPLFLIRGLDITPAGGSLVGGGDAGKVAFRFDIVTLVRSTATENK